MEELLLSAAEYAWC